jgi:hypothetical protein
MLDERIFERKSQAEESADNAGLDSVDSLSRYRLGLMGPAWSVPLAEVVSSGRDGHGVLAEGKSTIRKAISRVEESVSARNS